MLGALIGIWLTPGARDIIPMMVELPLAKFQAVKVPDAKVLKTIS